MLLIVFNQVEKVGIFTKEGNQSGTMERRGITFSRTSYE